MMERAKLVAIFYANITKLWGEEGFNLVYGTVKFLVEGVKSKLPSMQRLLDKRQISLSNFE